MGLGDRLGSCLEGARRVELLLVSPGTGLAGVTVALDDDEWVILGRGVSD